MQPIIVTFFYILMHLSVSAADTPAGKRISRAVEKTEEAIEDNNNNLLPLRYQTENAHKEYLLNLEDDESINFAKYKELLDDEHKKGLPGFLCLSIGFQNDKEFPRVYDLQSFAKWMKHHKTDPFSREPINAANLRYFLVRNRNNTNPPTYKATFLFQGDAADPLHQALGQFNKKDHHATNLELNGAAFYADVTRQYTKSHPNLALKFIKFGLEGIPREPQGLLAVHRNHFLRTAGDIHANAGNYNTALICYRKAINLNDSYAIGAAANLCLKLGGDYISKQIELFEERAATESDQFFLQKIYTNIVPLYQKIGNQEAADAASAKIIDLDHAITNSFKRERAQSPTGSQNNLPVTPKRARQNTTPN